MVPDGLLRHAANSQCQLEMIQLKVASLGSTGMRMVILKSVKIHMDGLLNMTGLLTSLEEEIHPKTLKATPKLFSSMEIMIHGMVVV